MNVDFAEEAIADEAVFNTSFVEATLAPAENLSKSLNDIHALNIPQNGLRQNSLAYKSEITLYVSISNEPVTCSFARVSTLT